MLTLSQAMLWFHEACREPLDLMAIVNCAVALDALALGQRGKGIRRLICARLGIGLNDACVGALTPNDIVHQIYERTRNQAAHGREPPFGRDWSRTRALAETTTRRMIIECLYWANDHPNLDDPARLATTVASAATAISNSPPADSLWQKLRMAEGGRWGWFIEIQLYWRCRRSTGATSHVLRVGWRSARLRLVAGGLLGTQSPICRQIGIGQPLIAKDCCQ